MLKRRKTWTYASHAREIATNSERILDAWGRPNTAVQALFDTAATRAIEAQATALLPAHALMQHAGLALARLTLAIAPHAQVIWIACGPGNNGGDGFEAAKHLQLWGKTPVVTSLASAQHWPVDAAASRQSAINSGVRFCAEPPDSYDVCIDALFGMGHLRQFTGQCAQWIGRINAGTAPVLAADIPSGLNADNGSTSSLCVQANATLSLLTLKPGLFTADGRQVCGDIWFDALGVVPGVSACAQLNAPHPLPARAHNTHKGSFGDVAIVGGGCGMTGAALLAARAALHAGAGRVYAALLDTDSLRLDPTQPELMLRKPGELNLQTMAVVAGCGGGTAVGAHLPRLLQHAWRLVLDADALNAIAADPALQQQLTSRAAGTTVLTPHPLEAARIMGLSCTEVQSDRIGLALAMADRFACTVALKGSGTIIAKSGQIPRINTTGNARLASAGTGDVLAGMIGARLASAEDPFDATCGAVFQHGLVASSWVSNCALTARTLAQAI